MKKFAFGIIFIMIGLIIASLVVAMGLNLLKPNISNDTKYMIQGFLVFLSPFCLLFLTFGVLLLKWKSSTASLIAIRIILILFFVLFASFTIHTAHWEKFLILMLTIISLVSFAAICSFVISLMRNKSKRA